MRVFLNPTHSPQWTVMVGMLLIGTGVALSVNRLKTVGAETHSNSIAQYRAQICRVLPSHETVTLGAYYFQPQQSANGQLSGSLLPEGVYICDRFGNSARIERGGYAQHVVTGTDISGINKDLEKRLEDPRSPDSSEATQVRRARNLGIWKPPASDKSPEEQFFRIDQAPTQEREEQPYDPNAEG